MEEANGLDKRFKTSAIWCLLDQKPYLKNVITLTIPNIIHLRLSGKFLWKVRIRFNTPRRVLEVHILWIMGIFLRVPAHEAFFIVGYFSILLHRRFEFLRARGFEIFIHGRGIEGGAALKPEYEGGTGEAIIFL